MLQVVVTDVVRVGTALCMLQSCTQKLYAAKALLHIRALLCIFVLSDSVSQHDLHACIIKCGMKA